MNDHPIIDIENLRVEYPTNEGNLLVVDNFSLHIKQGEIHGIIGESGSGKSTMALALLDLLSHDFIVKVDRMSLYGVNLKELSLLQRQQHITSLTSIIFQETESSLNPCFTVGQHLEETIKLHFKLSRKERYIKIIELLESVGFHAPEQRIKLYPHQLSVGMRQRVSIAIGIACNPKLLIADEPTTGLDVSIQPQILNLLVKLTQEHEMALMLISRDIGNLIRYSQSMTVMYCGQHVESGKTKQIVHSPRHPYTKALLDIIPHYEEHSSSKKVHLQALKGYTPSLYRLPVGCNLGPRCPYAAKKCVDIPRIDINAKRPVRCHFPLETELGIDEKL